MGSLLGTQEAVSPSAQGLQPSALSATVDTSTNAKGTCPPWRRARPLSAPRRPRNWDSVSTQAMNTASRRREFALLGLTGGSRSQVLAMTRRESFAVAAVGGGLGTLLSVPPLVQISPALTGPWPTAPTLGRLAVIGATALLAVAGGMLPTRLMLRARPVEAIGIQE
ncbi:FtsX-like permease family protein [Streptomyces sp. NPDC058291]|uniref:FtsX-like permease family protein n=1 Tax=Streptomyces sp. NPDC058291 TaxID=3346427 RepID=UPI0036EE795B